MKIMRAQFQCAVRKSRKAACFDVDNTILILQSTFDQQEFALCHCEAIPFIEIWGNDNVGDPSFILH